MADIQNVDSIQLRLLEEVADLHEVPAGAYNIRANGQMAGRVNSANIEIVSKDEGEGIDIHIKAGTKHESVHIPVVLSQSGLTEMVYNDFYIGDGADVVIVAGCGIHNGGDKDSRHDGLHRFFLGKNAKVRYVEKHYGSGDGMGQTNIERRQSPQILHLAILHRHTAAKADSVAALYGEIALPNALQRTVSTGPGGDLHRQFQVLPGHRPVRRQGQLIPADGHRGASPRPEPDLLYPTPHQGRQSHGPRPEPGRQDLHRLFKAIHRLPLLFGIGSGLSYERSSHFMNDRRKKSGQAFTCPPDTK